MTTPQPATPQPAAPLAVLVVDDDFYVADVHRARVEAQPGLTALPSVGTAAEARRVVARERGRPRTARPLPARRQRARPAARARRRRVRPQRGVRPGDRAVGAPPGRARLSDQAVRGRACSTSDSGPTCGSGTCSTSGRGRPGGAGARPAHPPLGRRPRLLVPLALGDGTGRAGGGGRLARGALGRRRGRPRRRSRATAQRYLATLAGDGHLTMQLRYGTTGRPEHRYLRA